LRYSIKNNDIRTLFEEKLFTELYMKVFEDLISATSKPNVKNIINLNKNCEQLNFLTIERQMRLIEPNLQMFIPYTCTWDENELNGYQVWEQFKEIGNKKEWTYAQRMISYSKLALQMSYFTFNTSRNKIPSGIEEYGGYYFIDGGERFIEDGILDREALEKYYGGIFL
jgi:CRISPR-associated endonuclease/helicase Cas3